MSLWFSYNLCLLSGFWLYGFFNKTYKFQRLFNALIERIWTWRSLVFYTWLNHDKMTFRERAKVSFFLTLSCSEAISISNMHWKSISDFQNNALIDLKQPRLTFNRKIFLFVTCFQLQYPWLSSCSLFSLPFPARHVRAIRFMFPRLSLELNIFFGCQKITSLPDILFVLFIKNEICEGSLLFGLP